MANGSMPVLVGVGQSVSHWDASEGAASAPSFVSLAIEAAGRAIADAAGNGVSAAIDTIAMTRTMEDSINGFPLPFGRCDNLPRAVAEGIGASPEQAIYAVAGGQSPQALVNEMATRIYRGDNHVALVAGVEAIGARKAALKASLQLDFGKEVAGQLEDRGLGTMLLNRTEIKHGMITPAFFYAMFENAYAHKAGHTLSAHRQAMGELFTGFADVAAQNRYAQFPEKRSAAFLATPSKENYPFADPYLKWHMAQDAVNMAAAVLIMSSEKADELGISEDARVYLHGAGEANDDYITERPRLDGSWAMQVALERAFDQAGKSPDDMALLDLYSCFPIAVFSSTQELGIDWKNDPRALTQTGGLPFFGGPGNNYSLHGIASMVEGLRAARGEFGLVLANGGWMTKEAVGIYSTIRPEAFTPVEPVAKPAEKIEMDDAPSSGKLETFTVIHGRKGPSHAICFGRTSAGNRFVATSNAKDVIEKLQGETLPIGAPITVTSEGEVNTFQFA